MAVEVKCQQGMYLGPITIKTIYLSGYIDFYIVSYIIKKFSMCLGLGNKIQVKKNVHSLCVQFLQFLFSTNILIPYF